MGNNHDHDQEDDAYNNDDAEVESDGLSGYDGLATYLRDISRAPLLTKQDETYLFTMMRAGDQAARAKLIESHLRLVISVATRYTKSPHLLADLIGEGNAGLMKAVDTFDPAKGRLSTHATCWIKKAIFQTLRKHERAVRLPVHIIDQIGRMRRTAFELSANLGRASTDQELAGALGLSLVKLSRLRALESKPISMDAPIDNDDADSDVTTTLHDALADTQASTPRDCAARREARDKITAAMRGLTPRERGVIELHYAMNGESDKLDMLSIAKRLKVSRQAAYQIRDRAFNKMRCALSSKVGGVDAL